MRNTNTSPSTAFKCHYTPNYSTNFSHFRNVVVTYSAMFFLLVELNRLIKCLETQKCCSYHLLPLSCLCQVHGWDFSLLATMALLGCLAHSQWCHVHQLIHSVVLMDYYNRRYIFPEVTCDNFARPMKKKIRVQIGRNLVELNLVALVESCLTRGKYSSVSLKLECRFLVL